jgi:NitT/TauT family transport system substrate-binding protein
MTLTAILRQHGLPASKVHFVAMPFPAMAQALQRHVIDAAWLPEPFGSEFSATMGLQELCDLDQGATTSFPVSWYVVTKAWAKKYPHTLAAFLAALRQGQEIADTQRTAVEQAMEKLPNPYSVPPTIASVMSLETYPLNVAPDIDEARVQRVANEMYQFNMLTQPFHVSSMLGGL